MMFYSRSGSITHIIIQTLQFIYLLLIQIRKMLRYVSQQYTLQLNQDKSLESTKKIIYDKKDDRIGST